MKNYNKIIWGIVIIALGIILTLNALNVTSITIFFDGWWTLFIIVPCLVGLIKGNNLKGNAIGIFIGVYLLLCCLDIISFGLFWKLLIPVTVLIIGVNLILGGVDHKRSSSIRKTLKENGATPEIVFSAFNSNNTSFRGRIFEGAELTAAFGSIRYDLRDAPIDTDSVIDFTCVFGGIDIIVPEGVNVKVHSTSLFGGVSNKTLKNDSAPTLYVSGLCLFGGVDIK